MTKTIIYSLLASGMMMTVACNHETTEDLVPVPTPEPTFVNLPELQDTSPYGRAAKSDYAVYMAEYITIGESGTMGNTVFFKDLGNKQLAGDFVPDLELSLDGTTDITYYTDLNRPPSNIAAGAMDGAIDNAMGTWDEVTCSELGLTKVPFNGSATGFVAAVFGFGGSTNYFSDVIHNGWMPGAFFDALAPGGSTFILGATFTIVFTDDQGNLVDTDNNGKYDVAWREIYYNDAFSWGIGSDIDVETVVLHEAGHGLSQAHFGKAFRSGGNGQLHFAPRAVMNAAYSGVQTSIGKTDNAGHCSNWSQWPNN